MGTTVTPEEKLDFIKSRVSTLLAKELRKIDKAESSTARAAEAVKALEAKLVCSSRAFVFSFYLTKFEELRNAHTAEETVQTVQRALAFALARKAVSNVTGAEIAVKTAAELGGLGELQLIFLEAETGDTSGEVI